MKWVNKYSFSFEVGTFFCDITYLAISLIPCSKLDQHKRINTLRDLDPQVKMQLKPIVSVSPMNMSRITNKFFKLLFILILTKH